MDRMDVEQQRVQLLELRKRLSRRIRGARAELVNPRDGASELSAIDNHPADVASDVHDRGRAMGTHADAQSRLAAIDAALGRLDDGTYGRCEVCQRSIGPERLRAMPETARCLECASDREDWQRPPEEDGLRETVRNMGVDERGDTGWRLIGLLEEFGSAQGPGGPLREED